MIPRFSDEDLEPILGANLVEAAEYGAVKEWGIPAGLPSTGLLMMDPAQELKVTVVLSNQRLDLVEVPNSLKPKTFDISFPSAFVFDDKDPNAAGELRFWFYVDVRGPNQDEDEPPLRHVELGHTKVLHIEAPQDKSFRGPPHCSVEAHVGDLLELKVRGLDYDELWLGDPHDRLGVARFTAEVSQDDTIDYRIGGELSYMSDNGDFEARTLVTTTSPPPQPLLKFQSDNSGNLPTMTVPPGSVIVLEYLGVVPWVRGGGLYRSVDGGDTWQQIAPLDTGNSEGTFDITMDESAHFQLQVGNIAGITYSRQLTVTTA